VRDNFFVLGLCRFGQELKYLCVPIGIVICDLLVHKPVDDTQIAFGEGLSGRKETFILWRNVYPCVPKNPVCRKNFMVWGS
jgi:hypothetical protein